MSVRHEQAQRRRAALIDAALSVFADMGVDGASMKDIAKAASVTPGLLYHYFTSKEALVAAVLEERGFLPQLRELLNQHADEAVGVVLPRLVAAFDDMLAANADLVSMFFSSGRHTNATTGAALNDFAATGHSLLQTYLSTRAAKGQLRADLIPVASQAMFAAVSIGHKTGPRINAGELAEFVLAGLRNDKVRST